MVKTKCLFDRPEDSDGTRLVVAYKLPSKNYLSRFNAFWELALAPNKTTVRAYKSRRITWKEYTALYLAKMALPEAIEIIGKWAKLVAGGTTITLLCYEKEGNSHCHRHLLKRLIKKQAKELKVTKAYRKAYGRLCNQEEPDEPDDGLISLGEEQAMQQFGVPPL